MVLFSLVKISFKCFSSLPRSFLFFTQRFSKTKKGRGFLCPKGSKDSKISSISKSISLGSKIPKISSVSKNSLSEICEHSFLILFLNCSKFSEFKLIPAAPL